MARLYIAELMNYSASLLLVVLLSNKNVLSQAVGTCNLTTPCGEGLFCEEGTCLECDWHSHYCFESNLTADGVDNCFQSCYSSWCEDAVYSWVGVNSDVWYEALHLFGGFIGNSTGPLVDIGLGIGDLAAYAGNNSNISGSMCLIERGNVSFYEKVFNCQSNGGIGAIIFNNVEGNIQGVIYDQYTDIPSVTIDMETGIKLRNESIGSATEIWFRDYGEYCRYECSVHTDCPDNYFCNFDFETFGYCEECSQDSNCYFSGLPLPGAKDCAATCGASLTFDDCKLCMKSLTGETLGTATSESDTCAFCPNGLDPSFENIIVPMFGDGTSCFLVDEYFRNYNISIHDQNCQIGLMYNYLCGCEGGTGYAGANTSGKRKAFVWLPRCTAILSFIGSSIIILNIMRNERKRSSMNNQLMVALSIFDLFGSAAFSLTSLPAPTDDGIYGSLGDNATCTAQGFFIQLGTTAAFLNVSLSIYYLLVIKFKWTENKLRQYRLFFFACPIAIGLAFAFAGIPFYTNTILWCNNGARWWPEIPVILAIILATINMTIVCLHVYKEEQASKKWRQGENTNNNRLSRAVFWQSFWYLVVFYITWPTYLALQYMWSSGKAYSAYGMVLSAGSLVTLQGFWNCVTYRRHDLNAQMTSMANSISTVFRSSSSIGSIFRSSTNKRSSNFSTERTTTGAKESVNASACETGVDRGKDENTKLGGIPEETLENSNDPEG